MIEVPATDKRGILEAQKQWIQTINTVSLRPPTITRTWMNGITPGKRLEARDYHWHYPYQYREMLLNEIPYDLDEVDYFMLKMVLQPVLDFLDSENIPYLKAGSGGSKSIHVHVFFKPMIQCVWYTWKEVRLALWNWILDGAEVEEGLRGDGMNMEAGCNYIFDRSCANFRDSGHAKVMRDFGGRARGKKHKSLLIGELPETREEVYDGIVRFPEKIEMWDASDLMGGFDFKADAPATCKECPVNIDWAVSEGIGGKGQYPDICRECEKVYDYPMVVRV